MEISVIIPLFNKENCIQRALQSVLAQTYPHFEIIVVDDGSTDQSYERAFEIKDTRIRIIQQSNQGVSSARNRGIREARYKWVAFLDADDEWLPNFLENVTSLINDFPTARVYATAYLVGTGKVMTMVSTSTQFDMGWTGILTDFFAASLISLPFCASSIAVQRDSLVEVSMFPEGVNLTEDSETWVRLALRYSIAYKYLPLVVYHHDAENRYLKLPSLKELYVTQRCKKYILDAPDHFRDSMQDFIARHEIFRAKQLLLNYDYQSAKEALYSCKRSSYFHSSYMKLSRLLSYPHFLRVLLIYGYKKLKYLRAVYEDFLGVSL